MKHKKISNKNRGFRENINTPQSDKKRRFRKHLPSLHKYLIKKGLIQYS